MSQSDVVFGTWVIITKVRSRITRKGVLQFREMFVHFGIIEEIIRAFESFTFCATLRKLSEKTPPRYVK